MLGLADRTKLLDLMEAVLSGRGEAAMTIMADLYRAGADRRLFCRICSILPI